MNVNAAKALVTIIWLSAAGFGIASGCSSEDPASPPDGSASQTSAGAGNTTAPTANAVGTPTATGSASSSSGVTATAAGTPSSGTPTSGTASVTSGSGGAGAGATLVTSTTSPATSAASGAGGSTAATTSATTGGAATLTDEQCQGIGNGDPCTTEGTCAPRACGLADTGTRTCSCGAGDAECTSATCWDCSSCTWTEPYPEVAVPPETPLTACASDVADEVACAMRGDRCMQGEEVCACWLEDDAGPIWDCDDAPSFWP